MQEQEQTNVDSVFVPVKGQRLVLIHEDDPTRENQYYICVSVDGPAIKLEEARLGSVVIFTMENIEKHGATLRPLRAGEKMPRAKQLSQKDLEKKMRRQMRGK